MIPRRPLRDDVKQEIRQRIVDGRLAAGARVHESRLSAELSVSRTPLREAMLGLEAAGFLTSDMGRGFLVPELDPRAFVDQGVVAARLEGLALEMAPLPASRRAMELQNLTGRARLALGRPDTAAAAAAGLLGAWASQQFAACPNPVLLDDILRYEALGARYWHAAVARGWHAGTLLASLEELLAALREGRRESAAATWPETRAEMAEQAAAVLS